jgi:hypothetical protein
MNRGSPGNGNGGRQTAEPTNQKNASPTDSRTGSEGQETRRNSAACFANPRKRENWQADFIGVMVTENLPAGTKCWVNVTKRLDKHGKVFVTVTLKAQ